MECNRFRMVRRLKANIGFNATLKPESLLQLGSALKYFLEWQISCSGYDMHGPRFNVSENHITLLKNIKCHLSARFGLDIKSGQ